MVEFIPFQNVTLAVILLDNCRAEGLPVIHEKDIPIADDLAIFASAIVRLLKDRDFANGMARNLKTLVHEKNSISSLIREGISILEHLASMDKIT